MRDEKQFWTMSWRQPYVAWPKSQPRPEPELMDLTQAREVLARIMAL